MKVVLFGKMRSGKDTVGEMLINDYGFQRFAFGDGIGEIITKYFPTAFDEGKPRHHYQFIGQQLRQLDKDVWIKYLLNTVEEAENKTDSDEFHVVVCDGRQENEAERMRENGYVVIKVEADEDIRLARIKASGDTFNPEQLYHETELQVDKINADFTIKNNGTLAELRHAVFITMAKIRANELGLGLGEFLGYLAIRNIVIGGY